MFLPATREPDPGDMFTFIVIASLMGGRAPDQGPMNIAQVIHVEQSVTPFIFRDFSKVDCVLFFKNLSLPWYWTEIIGLFKKKLLCCSCRKLPAYIFLSYLAYTRP